MKKEIGIGQAQYLTSPNPFAIVSSLKEDESTNVMALSWWTYVSNHPALVAIAIGNNSMTGKNIREREYFAVSLIGKELGHAAFLCGTCHGFDCDKAEMFGIPLTREGADPVAYVAGARVNLICKLRRAIDLDDHSLYIGEVIRTYGDEDVEAVYAINGYGRPAVITGVETC
ncbi:MAG: flavin reductase family protein, partial [Oscillospiraceae bacterium]|nr:flavin reductase family protein [Oscillospiraceae bacterium]